MRVHIHIQQNVEIDGHKLIYNQTANRPNVYGKYFCWPKQIDFHTTTSGWLLSKRTEIKQRMKNNLKFKENLTLKGDGIRES